MDMSDLQSDAIASAIAKATRWKKNRHKDWTRAQLARTGSPACTYCAASLDASGSASQLDFLVPPNLGGADLDENRVLACSSCGNAKQGRDVIGWPAFTTFGTPESRDRVLALRAYVLERSPNHLTKTALGCPREHVMRALRKRWEKPRFKVFAVQSETFGYIGWTTRCGSGDALGLPAVVLKFACRALDLSTKDVVLYRLPASELLDVVWALIEEHALVHRLKVDGVPCPGIDEKDWRAHFGEHFSHIDDLRRRRLRRAGLNRVLMRDGEVFVPQALPAPPREPSQKRSAVVKRAWRERTEKAERMERYLRERDLFDQFNRDVEAGLLHKPSPRMWLEMSLAIDQILIGKGP